MPRIHSYDRLIRFYKAISTAQHLTPEGYYVGTVSSAATEAKLLSPQTGYISLKYLERFGSVKLYTRDVSSPSSKQPRMHVSIQITGRAPSRREFAQLVTTMSKERNI